MLKVVTMNKNKHIFYVVLYASDVDVAAADQNTLQVNFFCSFPQAGFADLRADLKTNTCHHFVIFKSTVTSETPVHAAKKKKVKKMFLRSQECEPVRIKEAEIAPNSSLKLQNIRPRRN